MTYRREIVCALRYGDRSAAATRRSRRWPFAQPNDLVDRKRS
jgi:hypothetical protein